MKRIVVIFIAVMFLFGLSCGCSKKKQAQEPNQPPPARQATQQVDANSKADVNTAMLNRAVQKTTEAQSGERRPR